MAARCERFWCAVSTWRAVSTGGGCCERAPDCVPSRCTGRRDQERWFSAGVKGGSAAVWGTHGAADPWAGWSRATFTLPPVATAVVVLCVPAAMALRGGGGDYDSDSEHRQVEAEADIDKLLAKLWQIRRGKLRCDLPAMLVLALCQPGDPGGEPGADTPPIDSPSYDTNTIPYLQQLMSQIGLVDGPVDVPLAAAEEVTGEVAPATPAGGPPTDGAQAKRRRVSYAVYAQGLHAAATPSAHALGGWANPDLSHLCNALVAAASSPENLTVLLEWFFTELQPTSDMMKGNGIYQTTHGRERAHARLYYNAWLYNQCVRSAFRPRPGCTGLSGGAAVRFTSPVLMPLVQCSVPLVEHLASLALAVDAFGESMVLHRHRFTSCGFTYVEFNGMDKVSSSGDVLLPLKTTIAGIVQDLGLDEASVVVWVRKRDDHHRLLLPPRLQPLPSKKASEEPPPSTDADAHLRIFLPLGLIEQLLGGCAFRYNVPGSSPVCFGSVTDAASALVVSNAMASGVVPVTDGHHAFEHPFELVGAFREALASGRGKRSARLVQEKAPPAHYLFVTGLPKHECDPEHKLAEATQFEKECATGTQSDSMDVSSMSCVRWVVGLQHYCRGTLSKTESSTGAMISTVLCNPVCDAWHDSEISSIGAHLEKFRNDPTYLAAGV